MVPISTFVPLEPLHFFVLPQLVIKKATSKMLILIIVIFIVQL
jgi:hypothetical protein